MLEVITTWQLPPIWGEPTYFYGWMVALTAFSAFFAGFVRSRKQNLRSLPVVRASFLTSGTQIYIEGYALDAGKDVYFLLPITDTDFYFGNLFLNVNETGKHISVFRYNVRFLETALPYPFIAIAALTACFTAEMTYGGEFIIVLIALISGYFGTKYKYKEHNTDKNKLTPFTPPKRPLWKRFMYLLLASVFIGIAGLSFNSAINQVKCALQAPVIIQKGTITSYKHTDKNPFTDQLFRSGRHISNFRFIPVVNSTEAQNLLVADRFKGHKTYPLGTEVVVRQCDQSPETLFIDRGFFEYTRALGTILFAITLTLIALVTLITRVLPQRPVTSRP